MPSLTARQSAVLVVDVQQALFHTDPPPFEADAVMARVNHVTSLAHRSGVPVITVQHDGDAHDGLKPFSPGWQLHEQLQVPPGAVQIRKATCDAFFETNLESELRARRVETVILAGYATDFCIDTTLRNALSRNFHVVVIGDAHTTNDSPVPESIRHSGSP
jgi:nicotinamidase-related amidase